MWMDIHQGRVRGQPDRVVNKFPSPITFQGCVFSLQVLMLLQGSWAVFPASCIRGNLLFSRGSREPQTQALAVSRHVGSVLRCTYLPFFRLPVCPVIFKIN